jgi:PAS domain S-box-containing protein
MHDDVTILAVEDDSMNMEMLDAILFELDCRLLKAENGQQALELMASETLIDVVLMDLEMPVMNGYEAIERIRLNDRWRDIPIIVVTGDAHETTRTLAMGANDFISKPFNPDELRLRVMNQVRNKKNSDLAKENLQKSEALLEQLLQSTEQGIYSTDREGCCTFVNQPGLRILGYRHDECIGRNIHELVHRHCSVGLPSSSEECPVHTVLLQCTSYRTDNELLWRKDGTSFPANFSSNPLIENGVVSGAVITFTDITERKRFEAERFKLSRAVEQSPVSIVITDMRGTIEFVNPRYTEITGYRAEDVISQKQQVLHAGLVPPELCAELSAVIATGTTWEGEFLTTSKDGRLFWEQAAISALRDDSGAITHYLAVKVDITEKKNMLEQLTTAKEQAEAASQAKSSFLATMSHEIRTPMNGVIGMTGMLLETALNPEQKEFAEIVRRSGENLLIIINEILDFSKIEAGKLDLEMLEFDLRVTLEDTAELLALRADDSGLELICRIDPAVPSYLKGDPGRLRQVITNLTGNAIKFTRKGEVVINATLLSEQDGCATILFEISDTGIGIPESRLGAIFDPFTQVDGSVTRKYGGTGLGLAISRQLTELMGGEIGVTSREGVGSTFWMKISFEKLALGETQCPASLSSAPQQKVDITTARMLVVDDNSTNRILMKTLLNHWGCRHEVAASGEEGLALLGAAARSGDPFRVALLDQEMPDMDGIELGRRIKADPLLESTLMVMVTSLARRGDVAVLEQIGFVGYLPKPVRQAQLYGCLELVLLRDSDPLGDAARQKPQGIITRHTVAESGWSGIRILLAEDNVINQKVAQHMLKTLGYKTDVVADGREALRALEMINYDLVLMDCQMPHLDGFEATVAIRDPESKVLNHAVPIFAMTANSMQGDREKCLQAGMDDYLSKPIKKEEMAEMIDRWFKNGTDTTVAQGTQENFHE